MSTPPTAPGSRVDLRIEKRSTRTAASVAGDTAFAVGLFVFTFTGVMALGVLLFTVYDKGWDRLAADPLDFVNSFVSRFGDRAGIKAALFGSLYLMGLTALFAVPIGIGAALWLEEFSPKNRLTGFVDANVANLAGVPSVVFGLLGLGVFVRTMQLGPSLLAGALTLSVMSLPVVIIAGREAIRAVPQSIRDGAYALGSTKWQMVRRQVLPAAFPGSMTGAILSLSRAVGETAPLLVVGAAVSIFTVPDQLGDQFSALPMLIFNWTGRPQASFTEAAAAAIIVLLALLLAMNAMAVFLRNRFSIRW